MVVQVKQELCAGCGACVDACAAGAIEMVDQWAVIVDARCTQCEACVEVCPNGAITATTMQPYPAPMAALPANQNSQAPARQPVPLAETAPAARGLVPLAGAALAFVGREVAPRLADMLIDALERRLSRPTTSPIVPQFVSTRSFTPRGKGEPRRLRTRRRQAGHKICKERR